VVLFILRSCRHPFPLFTPHPLYHFHSLKMRSSLVPIFLTILFTLFPAILAHNPKPSSTPRNPGWYCPETDEHSRSKIEEFCDKPPHKETLFRCSYDNGKGGNYVCSFDSKTGECTGGGEHCPKSANWLSEFHFKRAPTPKPTAAPAASPTPIKHRAARYMVNAVKV
jgi:hypothetical protein